MQTIRINRRQVYLVTSDEELGASLDHQISHFGYTIQTIKDFKNLEKTFAEHVSLAILVDLTSISDTDEVMEMIAEARRLSQNLPPLIFISDSNDQSIRLKAIRAGGKAFYTKPVDVISLVDKLDEQDTAVKSDPYRVLVVEDQVAVANYYQMVLKMAGMEARVVIDSTQVLPDLLEFHPDLILMDLYMPNVNGAELATLIRQMDEFVSIPIVFLSSEDDFAKHIEMMSLGSDDFLTKPIKASHLVALVRSRLERLKTLRSYMVRDSLTSLLNHTSFRGVLAQEVSRCKRQNTRLVLTMIDVDRFKLVNDSYGHAVGDSVLKGLSRLLKQRLRRSDIIGRYGGEEFVALFLDATPEQAFKVVDELRIHFSEMEFRSASNKPFAVTFSAGLATYPEFSSAKQLSDAADAALYQAKAAGRNCIIIATPETKEET